MKFDIVLINYYYYSYEEWKAVTRVGDGNSFSLPGDIFAMGPSC